MSDILEEIVSAKRLSLEGRKKEMPLGSLEKMAASVKKQSLEKALASPGVNIIAEIKRASPSAGLICRDFAPAAIAKEYEAGGAAAISVLTEEKYFGGAIDDLKAVKENTSLPVLRKDFIVDRYQIIESAAYGADAVLLMASVLEGPELARLVQDAREAGLAALVEIHAREELGKALDSGAKLIGINNRDLKDLSVDNSLAAALAQAVPADRVIVAESGIRGRSDVEACLKNGIRAFLVGETLMRSRDKIATLKELRNG